jgi:excisionase family DNA binding protein
LSPVLAAGSPFLEPGVRAGPERIERSAPMNTEPWVSVDHVAKHLGVVRDSIYRWIENRSLPAHRIGRLWKFKLSEVDDWVRAGSASEDADDRVPRKQRRRRS